MVNASRITKVRIYRVLVDIPYAWIPYVYQE